MSNDYGIEHSIEYLKDQVLEEIIGNSKFYVRFTECGTKKEMLEKIQAYFKHKVFTLAEVDIVVLAASTALNVNLYIWSRNRLVDSLTLIEVPAQGSAQSVILKYNCSGSSYHGFDHYQPIVKIKNLLSCQMLLTTCLVSRYLRFLTNFQLAHHIPVFLQITNLTTCLWT